MKKILLLSSAIALSIATMAQVAVQPKWDVTLQRMLRGQHSELSPVTRVAGVEVAPVTVEVTDAAEVMNFIQEAGYKATQITEGTLTAIIPLNFVEQLAALQSVSRINGSMRMQPTMDVARSQAGVDNIHTNALNDFETPFTGKGVIVGVIDQGFQYRHVAFLDSEKNSRVISLWNREKYPNDDQPTQNIPDSGQADNSGGHGTHVTGIAVGSKVEGVDYHGVAPEADIIMIPSTFSDSEILEDVAYIKRMAKAEGKPFVVNMSFGGHVGGHDGMSLYNRTLNDLVADNTGVFVCAASNDGNDKLHTSHVFTEDGEVRYVLIDNSTTTMNYSLLSIWEQTADGAKHISVEPCYFSKNSKKVTALSSSLQGHTTVDSAIDSYSKKQYVNVHNDYNRLVKEVGEEGIYFGVKITGKKGATIHVWNNSGLGYIYTPTSVSPVGGLNKEQFLVGDYDYLVSDGGSAEKAITVASYNTGRYQWSPLSKPEKIYEYAQYKTAGAISEFSSRGPVLTKDVMKPTIAGPGAVIISALNKYSADFSKTDVNVCASVKTSVIKEYFYGVKQGTSMSAPFVTGVIALWYQANPNLTHAQIMDILAETAINDEYTAMEGHNAWGYGKINAYDGLKKALKLASTDGINEMQNSEEPVSFQKGNNSWRILFNNNESYANITVTDLNGRIVEKQIVEQPKRGEELTVSLSNYPAGVYLINVATTKANITRKVMKN